MTQHEPLHEHDRQQAAQERGEHLTIADLSALEKEALLLLRGDEPRDLNLFALMERKLSLYVVADEVESLLLRMGLIRGSTLHGFVQLTPEGLRLQAELREGGGE